MAHDPEHDGLSLDQIVPPDVGQESPGPWKLEETADDETGYLGWTIYMPAPPPAVGIHPTPEPRAIADVYTTRADAMTMRAALEYWEALKTIAFPGLEDTDEAENHPKRHIAKLRQVARDAMGKR